MATKKRGKGQRRRYHVFGKYPVVGVLRWMGKRGFTADAATKALAAVGVRPKQSTVKISVRQGGSGDYELPKMEAAEQQRLLKHKTKGEE